MSIDELYQDLIIDHHRHPRCPGPVERPSASETVYNPLCGDQINLALRTEGDTICAIGCAGHGCAISQASGSMMAELCQGRTVAEVAGLVGKFRAMMKGELPESEAAGLADAASLAGVRRFPARTRCALLAWEALDLCLKKESTPGAAG